MQHFIDMHTYPSGSMFVGRKCLANSMRLIKKSFLPISFSSHSFPVNSSSPNSFHSTTKLSAIIHKSQSVNCSLIASSPFPPRSTAMNSSSSPSPPIDADEITFDIPDAIRVYRSGRVERFNTDELVPPSLDQPTGVQSKDVTINPTTGLSARLYLPPSSPTTTKKLPVLLYIHGGGFCLIRASSSRYHAHVNSLAARAGILTVSVDYRLAPENPLPAAYDDCWEALEWVLASSDPWLSEFGDLDNIFLAGDSAGANIVHNVGMRLGREGMEVEGLVMAHPFFWGKDRIGDEGVGERWKVQCLKAEDADALWPMVCPDTTGNDDPRINPVAEDAPGLETLGCRRVLVFVAELDLLRERGRLYYERLLKSWWEGEAEFFETEGEDHCFYFVKPESSKTEEIMERLVNFFNKA